MSESQPKPNVLWIMTDEQRVDSLGCYGNAWVKTPHLDGLAKRGILFHNAYCQSPVCVASRASMLTGTYPHECDVLENFYRLGLGRRERQKIAQSLHAVGPGEYKRRMERLKGAAFGEISGRFTRVPVDFYRNSSAFTQLQTAVAEELGVIDSGPRLPMLPELFEGSGYKTANIGKLHHGGFRTGFAYNAPVPQLEHAYWFGLRADYDESAFNLVQYPNHGAIFAGTFPAAAEETETHKWTDAAVDWLRANADSPFFLRLSIRAPHTPVLPPAPWDTMYDPEEMRLPEVSTGELMAAARHDQTREMPIFRNRFSPEEQRKTIASYYGLVAHVDHEVGRILNELDQLGLRENTIVVFNSDHGTLLGEHDIYQKEVFFREATQIPLMLAYPGSIPAGVAAPGPVQLIDIAPTLLSLAGIAIPHHMRGTDLVSQAGSAGGDKREAYSELYIGTAGEELLEGEPAGTIRRSVVSGQWRLSINYPDDEAYGPDGSLYDLETDPEERQNLYHNRAYREVVSTLTNRITEFVAAEPDQ